MRLTRCVTVLLLASVLATAAACGSRDAPKGGAPGATATASLDPQERGRRFAQCMRDNGIDMADPDPNGGALGGLRGRNYDPTKLQAALEKCRALLPNGGEGLRLDPEQQEKFRQWAQCMREHGIDVPDPDPNAGGLGLNPLAFDTNDPKFQAAFKACQDKFIRPGGKP